MAGFFAGLAKLVVTGEMAEDPDTGKMRNLLQCDRCETNLLYIPEGEEDEKKRLIENIGVRCDWLGNRP